MDNKFENEIWKPIPNFENIYEVSNYGRIKQADRLVVKGKKVLEKKGKILKKEGNIIELNKDGKIIKVSIYNLLKELFSISSLEANKKRTIGETERVEDLPGEEWREIEDWPGYFVSNIGRVKSIDREITDKSGKVIFRKGKLIAQFLDKKDKENAYFKVELSNGGRAERKFVHRLVGKAFVPNPDPSKYNVCNHLDENKKNNRADNIEWTDNTGNLQYSGKYCLNSRKHRENLNTPVEKYTKEKGTLETFSNLKEASIKTGLDLKEITECCLDFRKTTGGYSFRFANVG